MLDALNGANADANFAGNFNDAVASLQMRVNAGLKRAVEAGKTLGRPRISEKLEKRIREHLRAGSGILKVARDIGVGTGTVHRIAKEMARPFDAAVA
jgi:DNA invertase Pin-like site-specific DNA recombinase